MYRRTKGRDIKCVKRICIRRAHGTVRNGPNENRELVPSLKRVEETFGEKPQRALADGAFATGTNIRDVESCGIEFFSHLPLPSVAPKKNP